MDDLLGFLTHAGFSGLNSVLFAALFLVLRVKFREIDKKVNGLWDWHLIQKGIQRQQERVREWERELLHKEEDE